MTSKESSQLISIISSLYSNYKPMSFDLAVEAWRAIFHDVPYTIVVGALYSYARDNKEYPPTPGQINTIIQQATGREELSEADAWDLVLKALKNGIYGSEKEFDKLPEDVQKAIGSPQYLHSMAIAEDLNLSVESSNFFKRYRMVVQRRKNIENLPSGVREIAERIGAEKGLQIENKQDAYLLEQREHYAEVVRLAEEATEAEKDRVIKPLDQLNPRLRMLIEPSEQEETNDNAIEEYTMDEDEDLFA